MKIIKNKNISDLAPPKQKTDAFQIPYKPPEPFPKGNFVMLIIGSAGSGKSSFWNSLLLSHPTKKNKDAPRIYYRYMDKVLLISPSLSTLPLEKLKINENRLHMNYKDEIIEDFIEDEKEGENLNNLIIIDDSIKQIKNNKVVGGLVCNRRHLTYNPNEEGNASLSVIITSQKWNALDTIVRLNASDIILYPTNNQKEINSIKDELMCDLNPKQQDELMKKAWSKKYSFIYIKNFEPTENRYYIKFDKVIFDDEDDLILNQEEEKNENDDLDKK